MEGQNEPRLGYQGIPLGSYLIPPWLNLTKHRRIAAAQAESAPVSQDEYRQSFEVPPVWDASQPSELAEQSSWQAERDEDTLDAMSQALGYLIAQRALPISPWAVIAGERLEELAQCYVAPRSPSSPSICTTCKYFSTDPAARRMPCAVVPSGPEEGSCAEYEPKNETADVQKVGDIIEQLSPAPQMGIGSVHSFAPSPIPF